MSAFLTKTTPGLVLLMVGFATTGFFDGRQALLAGIVCILGGTGIICWRKLS